MPIIEAIEMRVPPAIYQSAVLVLTTQLKSITTYLRKHHTVFTEVMCKLMSQTMPYSEACDVAGAYKAASWRSSKVEHDSTGQAEHREEIVTQDPSFRSQDKTGENSAEFETQPLSGYFAEFFGNPARSKHCDGLLSHAQERGTQDVSPAVFTDHHLPLAVLTVQVEAITSYLKKHPKAFTNFMCKTCPYSDPCVAGGVFGTASLVSDQAKRDSQSGPDRASEGGGLD
jgi:hypothetical protein